MITLVFHATRNMGGLLVFLAAGGLPLRGFYLEFALIVIAATIVMGRAWGSRLR